MWSDAFAAEERLSLPVNRRRALWSLLAALVGMVAMAGELVLSVQVSTEEFTRVGGDWVLGFVALALGVVGPYSAVLAWRREARRSECHPQWLTGASLAAMSVAGIAIGWLLLIHSSLHKPVTL